MSIILLWFFLFLSLGILYLGAEFALSSSVKIGNFFKLSPLTIGIFLIGFGTSLPEFFVSQLASMRGNYEIALGNIIGSNIGNIFLILGLAIFLSPIKLDHLNSKKSLFYHLIITVILGLIFFILKELFYISLIIFFSIFGYYIRETYIDSKKENQRSAAEQKVEVKKENFYLITLILLLGLGLLYAGGELLVYAGSEICLKLGISQYFISAVVIALGTSFPELATALLTIYKKHPADFIFGNIIGSNIFNIAFVLGSVGFYKVPIERSYLVEMALLTITSLFFIWANKKNLRIGKRFGTLFLLIYALMVTYWNQ